jgi:hypothetical protein
MNLASTDMSTGRIRKSGEIVIPINFTTEHAENAEDRISPETLRPLRTAFGAASQTAVIKHLDF